MLRFSKENFEWLIAFWETVKNHKPEYYIVTQDAAGWIDVQAKNELNEDDVRLVDEYKQSQKNLST